ncbi:NADH-quinone oxidoreductase subunit L [Melghirimyces profundicolus]|uniref:NADH-quinone oxidoreductase subunit L n=1 Tax=Melghirimyces profundicolus TaxID=1242148 RepID=A0A2T6C2H5_9BACL|nr:NADH-quinone oxidoreductase subunit L [Melghirimyces profundicolus]PTX62526.1 NADH-quinone oxidoreductase subunit L [Melghirimyces profundicolus]
MVANAWIIPLFPLIAFLILLAGRNAFSQNTAAWVGSVAALLSLGSSAAVLMERLGGSDSLAGLEWLSFGETTIRFGIEVNQLNALMLLIVSGVSFLVQVYSAGYMKGDGRVSVFYAYLGLFTFSMLGLVISPNLLQLYLFWELVGVCSFLLIGFWYFKPEAKRAAKKAFIVTRIGDIGLFIAVILTFIHAGSFELAQVFDAVKAGEIPPGTVTLIALLIFVGAVGKSGQFPLHTWLPDAMEGPTPVSALIHAATMVAAGVYLVARTFPVFEASPAAMNAVAWTGAFTAIFAASIGLVQNDIKRVLAYSTVSQLGYMMLALGSAGYAAGVFHLMTHAFFKALLFLAAGAVIVALHHEQDIRRMGGLWETHRTVGWFFLTGCLAISGIPPFAGFFSKDEILLAAFHDGRTGVFLVGVVTAFLTSFYMFRLFFLVFRGERRMEAKKVGPVPRVMIWPMGILALLSVLGGFVEYPGHGLSRWLSEGSGIVPAAEGEASFLVPLFSTVVSLTGIVLAWAMYDNKSLPRDFFSRPLPWTWRLLHRKYYVDEAYGKVIVTPYGWLGHFLAGFDRYIVGGAVRAVVKGVLLTGALVTGIQNGQAQTYALVSVIGLVLLIVGLTAGRLFG